MGQSAIQQNIRQLDKYHFKYPDLMYILSNNPVLNFKDLKDESILVGEGYCGKVYLYKKLNIVLKIMKGKPNIEKIIKEVLIMDKVNSIWPELFQYLVINEDNLVIGFSMKYFEGKKLWEVYRDPDNIYFKDPVSRIRLVKKVKQVVNKLQRIGVCHGDLHIDNIMIKQSDKTKEDCQLLIIDYGVGFMIDDYGIQKPQLTGWAFMKPSQAKTDYFYNTAGLNAYMFGRVALQILLLQNYDDYSRMREQSPERQLDMITQLGYDSSVRNQIELYLDKDINVRNKMLQQQSKMKQIIKDNPLRQTLLQKKQDYGWSLINLINAGHYDENYYCRHPEKLGYTQNKL